MNCSKCGKEMLPREVSAYSNRCEDCWSTGGDDWFIVTPQGVKLNEGAAGAYYKTKQGDASMITNQCPKRRRMK